MRQFFRLLPALLLLAIPAWALDLQTARNQGLVGELNDGYVKALQANPDLQALAADVNAKRQAEYRKISAANGQPIEVVAKLAAGQIVKNLGKGAKYQDSAGQWQTR